MPKPAPKPARRGAKPVPLKVATTRPGTAAGRPAKAVAGTQRQPGRPQAAAAKPATVRKSALPGKARPKPGTPSAKAKRPAVTAKTAVKRLVKAGVAKGMHKGSGKGVVKVSRPAPAPAKVKGKVIVRSAAKAVAAPVPPVTRTSPPPPPPHRVSAPPVSPPVPVATPPAKAKRKASGLGVRDLQHFADLLLEKRREIVGDMHSMEGEALRSGNGGLSNLPVHLADMGTDNYEQEFTLGLVEKDRSLLREINHALAKIPAGTYGICEGTGEPIGKARLEVQPWARHGIEYARQRERNGRGVRVFF